MVTATCLPPCVVAVPQDMPGQMPPVYVPEGFAQGYATDENLSSSVVLNDAVVGDWVELLAADPARNGATIRNTDATADVFVVQADVEPADGTAVGEIDIQNLTSYTFPFAPRRRYWMRSTVTVSPVERITW